MCGARTRWSEAHMNTIQMISGERSYQISKKIRKKSNFEFLIMKMGFKYKRRKKLKPNLLGYLLTKIKIENVYSEAYFFEFSKKFNSGYSKNMLMMLGIGSQMYFEKDFAIYLIQITTKEEEIIERKDSRAELCREIEMNTNSFAGVRGNFEMVEKQILARKRNLKCFGPQYGKCINLENKERIEARSMFEKFNYKRKSSEKEEVKVLRGILEVDRKFRRVVSSSGDSSQFGFNFINNIHEFS
jgi:hypothetical protein